VLRARQIDIAIRSEAGSTKQKSLDAAHGPDEVEAEYAAPTPIVLKAPWMPTSAVARKGVAWKPSAKASLDPESIETMLTAIAKARSWMDDLTNGRIESFDDVPPSEGKAERHIRFLAPLAFVSPRIVEAMLTGRRLPI
jgi:site-specific DNA recombinase